MVGAIQMIVPNRVFSNPIWHDNVRVLSVAYHYGNDNKTEHELVCHQYTGNKPV